MKLRLAIGMAWALAGTSGMAIAWLSLQTGRLSINDLSGILFVLGAVAVGSLILLRRPDNRIGALFGGIGVLWAVSNALLSFAIYLLATHGVGTGFVSWLGLAGSWMSDLAWISSVTFLFLLFPDGRLPSNRWRVVSWFTGGVISIGLALSLIEPGPLSQLPQMDNPLGQPGLAWLVDFSDRLEFAFVASVLACLVSIFLRYRRAAQGIRRQIKTVAYASLVLAFIYLSQDLVIVLWGADSSLSSLVDATGAIVFSAFPWMIGIAVLRHRLFDIDLIIRRTLQYTLLTGLLALAYFGGVIVLQEILGSRTGELNSPLVTVVTTLGVAALFNPLRVRTQAFIDRRFFRQKYDAERILAGFASLARDEVDMDRLAGALSSVVDEVFRPRQIEIRLRASPGALPKGKRP